VLQSTLAIKRFEGNVWAQGTAEMLLTPTGNNGNYFSDQHRSASRVEWVETLSLEPIQSHGMHNVTVGMTVTRTEGNADTVERPVSMLNTAGQLVKRIEFVPGLSLIHI